MIAYARLRNQRLSSAGFRTPSDVVSWLGAVQAQDYLGAKWAVAMRMRRGTDVAVEQAFAAGEILRTHVMRPTWHFVAPGDIRWMLQLTAPRIRATMAPYDRALEIDARLVGRSNRVIAAALKGDGQLTRQELKVRLRKAGIAADGVQRLAHLMMHAELDGVICSGPVRGKQFTYALLEERAPSGRTLPREAALAELTRRYFASHGPAQVQDFVWWSGLRASDARAGVDMLRRDLVEDVIDGKTYWRSASKRATKPPRTAHLLPLYDEYLIGYRDRSAVLDAESWKPIAGRDPFSAAVVLDGRVIGGWKRAVRNGMVAIDLYLPRSISNADSRLVTAAARRFGTFLGATVTTTRTDVSRRAP